MSQRSILVTGATGTQGQGVIHHCLSAPTGYKVYALVRDPTGAVPRSLEAAGAVLVKGDLNDAASVRSALERTQPTAVVLITPSGAAEQQLAQSRAVVAAARATASVEWFFLSSSMRTEDYESFPGMGPDHVMYDYWRSKYEVEDLVRSAGFANWTIVQLTLFLQLFSLPASRGIFPELSGGDGADGAGRKKQKRVLRTAFKPETQFDVVDGGDIGFAVAAALQRPDDFRQRVVKLAVEALTVGELADKIGKATGDEIEVVFETLEDMGRKLGPRLVAIQGLFNQIGSFIDAGSIRKEFGMTSVDEFFTKAATRGEL